MAVAINDQESVEDLLAYRANPDLAAEGEDPPLCVAVRNRRRNIVRSLLLYRADANVRSPVANSPLAAEHGRRGSTPVELAVGDHLLVEMITTYCCTPGEVIPFVNERKKRMSMPVRSVVCCLAHEGWKKFLCLLYLPQPAKVWLSGI